MKIKLYKPFEHWYHGGTIWVYSDPHFGDNENRTHGWPTDYEQIVMINKGLGRNDTIIFLGDIGDVEYIKKIKGYKVLIMGNHDKGASNYLKKYKVEVSTKGTLFESYNRVDVEDVVAEYNILEQHDDEAEVYDNHLFDEVYDGPLMINNHILLSHEAIDMSFGINIHGHNHGGKHISYDPASSVININVCSNVVGFKKLRLDELVDGLNYRDIHRIAIDKAITRKRNKSV